MSPLAIISENSSFQFLVVSTLWPFLWRFCSFMQHTAKMLPKSVFLSYNLLVGFIGSRMVSAIKNATENLLEPPGRLSRSHRKVDKWTTFLRKSVQQKSQKPKLTFFLFISWKICVFKVQISKEAYFKHLLTLLYLCSFITLPGNFFKAGRELTRSKMKNFENIV